MCATAPAMMCVYDLSLVIAYQEGVQCVHRLPSPIILLVMDGGGGGVDQGAVDESYT